MTVNYLIETLNNLLKEGKIQGDTEVLVSSLEQPTENSELFTSDVCVEKSPHEFEDDKEHNTVYINSIERTPNKSTYKDQYKKSFGTSYDKVDIGMRINKFELDILILNRKYFAIRKLIKKLKLDLTKYRFNLKKREKKMRRLTDKKRRQRVKEALKRQEKARIEYEAKLKALEEKRKQEDLPYEPELCY